MGHIERKLREKEAVRQRILDSALNLVIADGWDAVTIRKIAKEIEYTPPIVYEHFENKGDLQLEVIKRGFEKLYRKFKSEVGKETNSKVLLLKMSLVHWDFAFQNKKLYQLMFSLELPDHDSEMLSRFFEIRDLFSRFTGKAEHEVPEIIFNWICLITGTISAFMKLEHPVSQDFCTVCREPREIYVSFIERFLSGLKD